uniref:Glucuronosyltransferase n=1 Tax=Acrobeloides nanus TaxID=290746 RepID=A0A914CAU6_9BILA
MMREVGTEFPDDKITWIQLQAYDFGFTANHLPKNWKSMIIKNDDEEGKTLQEYGQYLIWHTTLPVDYDRLWDLKGMHFFFNILRRNHNLCKEMIYSGNFKKIAESHQFDLIVIDHHLQECLVVLVSLLNATVVEFSNWPITDGYISTMNVPSPPSYVPRTTTYFSGIQMDFISRVRNTIVDLIFTFARVTQRLAIWHFYGNIGYSNIDLMDVEAEHLFYAGRSELLTEVIRPVNNRIRHFGCAQCGPASNYYIKKPNSLEIFGTKTRGDKAASFIYVTNENSTECLKETCAEENSILKNQNLSEKIEERSVYFEENLEIFQNLNISELENRYLRVQEEYMDIDFDQLEKTKFILVSFGSVAKVEFMPTHLLDIFLDAFSQTNHLILWATNGDTSNLLKNKTLPSNLIVVRWAPIKILLAHRNLQYVIVHGGINTINELMLFGVPILGIPLQGDQPSNLQRLIDLGLGEMLDIKSVWQGELPYKMAKIQAQNQKFRLRSQKVSTMVNHHRSFTKNSQNFWLHWSKRHGNKLRKYVDQIREFDDPQPTAFMTREELIENASRKAVIAMKHADKVIDITKDEEISYFSKLTMGTDGNPIHLHLIMAIPTIMNNADEEQQKEWLPKALRREFIATYAQTEMGHGTNLKKLETTATYDPKTQEFILHSPTITSTKWWPGNLGKSSNHSVIMAQLYAQGKCYGAHLFFVQLRDIKTHQPLPGITIGDIGPKFGLYTNDNGFLRFDHVRIPRRSMFMKHVKILPDGTYVPPSHSKLNYSTMVYARASIVTDMAFYLLESSTIAVRYSCIRRQGEITPGAGEVKVLDYQTQQHRIFPQIARGVAFKLSGSYIMKLYMQTMEDIKNGDISAVPDLHALSCGLKTVTSHQAVLGLEQCRMACGGHGYLQASGFPLKYTAAVSACTYEGENMVMLLQTARHLVKMAKAIRSGRPPKPNKVIDYLFKKGSTKCLIDQSYEPNYQNVLEAFEHLARRITLEVYDKLVQLQQQGQSYELAWNECAVDLCKDGYMNGQQLTYAKKKVYDALAKIRPNAVSIVDSFDFHERELQSVLGRRDGHVYENLLKWAQMSPLNKHDIFIRLYKMSRYIREGDNPDLTEERRNASFDTEALGEFFHDAKYLKRRREIAEYVDQIREFDDPQPTAFMTREELIENVCRKAVIVMEHADKVIDVTKHEEIYYYNKLTMGIDGDPLHLHLIMAIPTIMNNADEEQQKEWLPKALRREFIATYAQTEMGHGTNLKKLETTATYDPKTQEFILHSPTITSTKWWPGNLGKSSNHSVVMAQLYAQGKCYGAHPFFVQLRDIKTHQPLPGITVGDIGPKFGIYTNDNGFLRFDHVRIPRRSMFMKHAKILPDGTYVPPSHSKLNYSAMVYVRASVVNLMASFLLESSTIAVRYSCIRRQGEITPGAGEVKVLDYQTQQHRIFPQIARGVAFKLSGSYIMKLYTQTMEDIKNGDISAVPDLHALSCGLKAITSHQAALGLEQCRMACGGHGYSQASGFPLKYTVAVGGCTYEGENMVMLLQTARHLVKMAKAIRSGHPSKPNNVIDYLFKKGSTKCLIDQSYDPNYQNVLEAFEHLARRVTLQVYDKLVQLQQQGQSYELSWNECAVDLCKASRAHVRTFLAKTFVEEVNQIADLSLKSVLQDLLQLYLFYEVTECAAGLLEDGFMNGQQLTYAKKKVYDALAKIRPNAVAIVDSFDFHERELQSVLGRRDGHVYENLLKWAQMSPLNKHDISITFIKMSRYIRDGDNPDLTEERRKASFDTEALSEHFYGARYLKKRREIAEYVDQIREFDDPQPTAFMTREELIENASRKAVIAMKHADKVIDITKDEEIHYFNRLTNGIDGNPIDLHLIMAIPTIMNNADEEQQKEWLPKALRREFIATYAQTEMGHGTNLKKLETTATYDPRTQEFILHSPTITSTKWWPGNLGKSSNHSVVMAQLYTQGKCYGAHPFFVQLRDIRTHQPLPGITVGDIGPKFGIYTNDNGFLRFDHVRIPRRSMFMKHAKVLPDGTYVPPSHSKLNYSAMVYVRATVVTDMAFYLLESSTIAVRYSCIRRQGEITPGTEEVKVLDYQTQQHRIFPQLARGVAFKLSGSYIMKLYTQTMEDIKNGDISAVPDLHALSCGLKAVTSHQAALGLEQCRMACGGHGYSQASGFPLKYTVAVGACTYEGENMVMLLQTARHLVKMAKAIRSGRPPKPNKVIDYLFKKGSTKCLIDQSYDPNYQNVLEAFEHLSRRVTLQVYDKLVQLQQQGQSYELAWNECAVDLCKASRAHVRTFLAKTFVEEVNQIANISIKCVLQDLLQLYLFYEVTECAAGLLEDGYMNGQQLTYAKTNVYDALAKIRSNAVAIVDSFDFHEQELQSVLGRRDGNVYENLLKWAQMSPLNKHDVLPFHHKYLGKMMEEARQKSKI